jgi:Spy/CpxP family protein refolding chaperone
MKNTLRILAAALVVASASVAQAQGGGGGGGGGANMAERQAAQRAALFEGITLTADQKTKIDSIYTAGQKATADLRAGMQQGTPPSDELRAKMMAVTTEQRKAIKAVLTAEQNVTFDANVAKMPQGRGRGGR